MSEAQKIIKIIAIAFAVFLIISIISGIAAAIMGITAMKIFNKNSDIAIYEETSKVWESSEISAYLSIDINASKLVIKTGDRFLAETNNKYVTCKQDKDKLVIREKSHVSFGKGMQSIITLYIPENLKFQRVDINTGAGSVDIESLETEVLNMNFGAGDVNIKNLVSGNTKIDTGAGKLDIQNGTLGDLDLSLGVGSSNITANINGNSKIGTGVGELILNLLGKKEDYEIKVNKGLGQVRVFDTLVSDGSVVGSGINKIKLDCGVGNISVNIND